MITRKSTGRLKSYMPSVVTLELPAATRKDPLTDRITRLKLKKKNPTSSLRKDKIDLLLQSIDFAGFFGATIGPSTFKQEINHSKTSYQVYKEERMARPKQSNKINQGNRQQSRSLLNRKKSKGFEGIGKWSNKDSFGMSSVLIGSLLIEKEQSRSTVGQSMQAESFKKQTRTSISRNKMNDSSFKFSISGNGSSFQESLPDTMTPNLDFSPKRRYVAWQKLSSNDKIGKGAIRSWTANHRSVKY